jgi:multiple sugar transport system permease protein
MSGSRRRRSPSDAQFQNSLKNTIIFTVTAVTIEFVLGIGFALLLDRYVRRFNFLKTILMIPMMIPPIAGAITWKLIYQPQFGILNEIMYWLGLPQLSWAGDARLALPSIIVADIWEWTPFIFLLMLAGLASLPAEPYEAADMDGASAWRQFWDLTLPFLKPVIAIALLLRIMDALRLFDLVFIFDGGACGGHGDDQPLPFQDRLHLHGRRLCLRPLDSRADLHRDHQASCSKRLA